MTEGTGCTRAIWPCALIPWAWLIPQHYLPWLAAHQDFAVLALLSVAVILCSDALTLPKAWAAAVLLAIASIALQWAIGTVRFSGDALMAVLYLTALGAAVAIGHSMTDTTAHQRTKHLLVLALGLLSACIASVAIALAQWTEMTSFFLPVAAMLPGDRPYGNLSQANQFCSAVFLGVCALCWMRAGGWIRTPTWALAMLFLLFGMTMSGSRTGWLQIAVLVACHVHLTQRPSHPYFGLGRATFVLVSFALLQVTWPALNDWALLSGSRSSTDQLQAGLRLPIWSMSLDAITRHPWMGFGWQQVASAQVAVALDHPPLHRLFEHSHNVLLDLFLWAGVPVGAAIAGLVAYSILKHARAPTSVPESRFLLAAMLGVLMHAMLEFPLEYAYLLIPFGVIAGAWYGTRPGQPLTRMSARSIRVLWAVWTASLAAVAIDYMAVEWDYRTVRLESTFGSRRITTALPEIRVLTQLEAYLRFIRTEARPGMNQAELAEFRAVASRFVHPPVLLRLALAEGLNGQPDAARAALRRICAIHLAARCDESRESWASLQMSFPVLAEIRAP